MPDLQEGALTLIVALEHVLVNRDWDRRYGHRVELRPGIKEFLQQARGVEKRPSLLRQLRRRARPSPRSAPRRVPS